MSAGESKEGLLRLTCDECRAVDRYAIETLGIPGVVLMENAGRNATDLIERWLLSRTYGGRPGRVAIVCGRGNNGGDGWVIARHLAGRGHAVSADLVGDPSKLTGDAAVNYAIAEKMGVPIYPLNDAGTLPAAVSRWRECDVVVDALLGTGFAGAVREPMAGIIEAINGTAGPIVVAIDVPSGLDADRGTAAGAAVRADYTITFLAAKTGYEQPGAKDFLGQVVVVDIGAPTELILARLGNT